MFDLCQCTQREKERERGASFSAFLEFQRGGEKVREFSSARGWIKWKMARRCTREVIFFKSETRS